jgi:putative redox protein
MDVKATWNGGMSFTGMAGSGFPVKMDAIPEDGGNGDGLRPLELLAIGLAGCTSMDVISILKKKRQQVSAYEVSVHADRATDHPKVFTKLELVYKITGKDIDPAAVERAIQLSAEKYCSAQAMLSKACPITSRFEIIPE